MNTKQQVEQQINQDYDKFVNGSYSGEVTVPINIIKIFMKAILAMPPFAHRINFLKVKSISNKEVKQLLVSDLNDIMKVLLNTPPEKLYEGDEGTIIEQCIKMDKFVISYNAFVDDFKGKLQLKKDNLLMIAGVKGNGLQIIA